MAKPDTVMAVHCDAVRKQVLRRSAAGSQRQALRRELERTVPSLNAVCRNPSSTVILAANQMFAINYYYWLVQAGIKVPKRMSILSFDNYLHLGCYPISTIDFCLEDIAYKIVHLFIGDIPVGADARGNFTAPPRLITRGSLAAPCPV